MFSEFESLVGNNFAIFADKSAKRLVDVVIKKTHPIFFKCQRQYLFFERKSFCRIEIEARDPCRPQVMLHWNKVRKTINSFAALFERPCLHCFRMSTHLMNS